jgi:enoyl-CoA hydratase/carnithine racemase
MDAGFLDQVVAAGEIRTKCLAAAKQLTALPPVTYGKMKRDIRESSLTRIAASLI